jgi:RNA polymerase sigma factor (sigma-70 family)
VSVRERPRAEAEQIFERLYAENVAAVERFLQRKGVEDWRDLGAEVWRRTWVDLLKQTDEAEPGPNGPDAALLQSRRGWVFKVAERVAIDEARRAKRVRRRMAVVHAPGNCVQQKAFEELLERTEERRWREEGEGGALDAPAEVERRWEREQARRQVRVALAELPELERQVLVRLGNRESHEEIARSVGITKRNVQEVRKRAIARFVEVYPRADGESG